MPSTTALTSAYAVHVANGDGGRRFGELLRQHRTLKGLRQEDVVERVRQQGGTVGQKGLSLSTYNRWERGEITNPKPPEVVAVCKVLGISTVHAGVALGYLTPEDADPIPEPPRQVSPHVLEALAVLEDPDVPEETKRTALEYLQFLRAKTKRPDTSESQPRAS